MKICSTSLAITDVKIKTIMIYCSTHTQMAIIKQQQKQKKEQKQKQTSIEKDVENLKFKFTVKV